MVRRRLVQSDLQKLPQAQRIRHTPSDTSFAVDPLEEADQHQTEVHARHQRRTAQLLVIELAAAALAELIEAGLVGHATIARPVRVYTAGVGCGLVSAGGQVS